MKLNLKRTTWSGSPPWLFIVASFFLLTGFVIYPGPSARSASQPNALLKVDPKLTQLQVGETARIELTIEQVTGLYGVELHLKFDPTVLEIIDANPEQDGVQLEKGTLPIPDFVVLNTADNAAGTADYAVTQLPPNQPGEGKGIVASLTVRAKKAATTRIEIERLLLADTMGNSIEAASQYGQVQVNADPTWILVAAGAFFIVSVGIVISFVVIRRK